MTDRRPFETTGRFVLCLAIGVAALGGLACATSGPASEELAAYLESATHLGDAQKRAMRDARPFVEVFKTDGTRERELELPGIGLLSGFNDDPASSTAFYGINTLYESGSTYEVDLTSGKSTLYSRPKMNHNPDDFEISQVFYESRDGTRVPMFVAHRRDLEHLLSLREGADER